MKCRYIKADGNQCAGLASTGSDFCFNHQPEYIEKVAQRAIDKEAELVARYSEAATDARRSMEALQAKAKEAKLECTKVESELRDYLEEVDILKRIMVSSDRQYWTLLGDAERALAIQPLGITADERIRLGLALIEAARERRLEKVQGGCMSSARTVKTYIEDAPDSPEDTPTPTPERFKFGKR